MTDEDFELLHAKQQGELVLERAKTAAASGRLCVAMAFALIIAVAALVDKQALWLAFFPLASVAFAYLVDRLYRPSLSILSIACAAASLLVIFYL